MEKITLRRDRDNEKSSGGKILLSYKKVFPNGDITFANIVNESGDVELHYLTPEGTRGGARFVGALPENIQKNREQYKKRIKTYFRQEGYEASLTG